MFLLDKIGIYLHISFSFKVVMAKDLDIFPLIDGHKRK